MSMYLENASRNVQGLGKLLTEYHFVTLPKGPFKYSEQKLFHEKKEYDVFFKSRIEEFWLMLKLIVLKLLLKIVLSKGKSFTIAILHFID